MHKSLCLVFLLEKKNVTKLPKSLSIEAKVLSCRMPLTRAFCCKMLQSSFLGRGSKNSLPSFRKHGSTPIRSFVFERDDSNSRSAISMSEDSSNLVNSIRKFNRVQAYASFQVNYNLL